MSDNLQKLKAIDDFNSKMIGHDMMSKSIKTELYFGGQFYQDHGSVQPRKFHYGLLKLALNAGVKVFGDQPAHSVKPRGSGFCITTKNQFIDCEQVLMATNGYTQSRVSKFLARRVLPVPSFIIVTEELGKDQVQALLPGGHCMVETRQSFCY